MNKVILMGRLTRDPDVKQTNSAEPMSVARFGVAVDRRGKKKDGQQSADFPNCVAFGKTAESIDKWLRKGTKVALEGHLQTGSYTKQDGTKVYTTDVVVESWEFAESKAAAESSGNSTAPASGSDSGDDFMQIPDGVEDELPFA